MANPTHAASQWQITLATDTGFAAVVEDSGEDAVNLLSYTVVTPLDHTTEYIWRVRYKDTSGDFSEYSVPFTLTTLVLDVRVTSIGDIRVTSAGDTRVSPQ